MIRSVDLLPPFTPLLLSILSTRDITSLRPLLRRFYLHECFSHFASLWFFSFPRFFVPFSRVSLFAAVCAIPPSPTCFSTILATMEIDIYMYLRELDSRRLLEWWNTSETWGNVMQINDKSEMVDVNKNLTRRKNWKGGGVFCEAKGFRRPDRHPIWNFSSAAITDTAICNFGRDSTFQTFIYPPIYPPRSIHSDYL